MLLAVFALSYLIATRSIFIRPEIAIVLNGVPLCGLVFLVFAYYIVMEATAGGTIGQQFARLRVVGVDGTHCGFTGSTIRTVLRPAEMAVANVPALLLVRWTKRRQTLGDLLASTMVITTDHVSPAAAWCASAILVASGLLGCLRFAGEIGGAIVALGSHG
jgi:uncharacterized RDD family membrane protein YckC